MLRALENERNHLMKVKQFTMQKVTWCAWKIPELGFQDVCIQFRAQVTCRNLILTMVVVGESNPNSSRTLYDLHLHSDILGHCYNVMVHEDFSTLGYKSKFDSDKHEFKISEWGRLYRTKDPYPILAWDPLTISRHHASQVLVASKLNNAFVELHFLLYVWRTSRYFHDWCRSVHAWPPYIIVV